MSCQGTLAYNFILCQLFSNLAYLGINGFMSEGGHLLFGDEDKGNDISRVRITLMPGQNSNRLCMIEITEIREHLLLLSLDMKVPHHRSDPTSEYVFVCGRGTYR